MEARDRVGPRALRTGPPPPRTGASRQAHRARAHRRVRRRIGHRRPQPARTGPAEPRRQRRSSHARGRPHRALGRPRHGRPRPAGGRRLRHAASRPNSCRACSIASTRSTSRAPERRFRPAAASGSPSSRPSSRGTAARSRPRTPRAAARASRFDSRILRWRLPDRRVTLSESHVCPARGLPIWRLRASGRGNRCLRPLGIRAGAHRADSYPAWSPLAFARRPTEQRPSNRCAPCGPVSDCRRRGPRSRRQIDNPLRRTTSRQTAADSSWLSRRLLPPGAEVVEWSRRELARRASGRNRAVGSERFAHERP